MSAEFTQALEEGLRVLRTEYPRIDWKIAEQPYGAFLVGGVGGGLAVTIRQSGAYGRGNRTCYHFIARLTPIDTAWSSKLESKTLLGKGCTSGTPLQALDNLLKRLCPQVRNLKRLEEAQDTLLGTTGGAEAFAERLEKAQIPLDGDISRLVGEEFWNLLA